MANVMAAFVLVFVVIAVIVLEEIAIVDIERKASGFWRTDATAVVTPNAAILVAFIKPDMLVVLVLVQVLVLVPVLVVVSLVVEFAIQ